MQERFDLMEGLCLDGYELLRKIGQGGFGQVWLSRNQATQELRALKWISSASIAHLDQELEALVLYREGLSRVPCQYLLPIEHVRQMDSGLFYTMPLADGPEGMQPEMPEWIPITLSTLIAGHQAYGSWFSTSEIKTIISNILEACHSLSQAGVVHRDIKPDNVLFFRGQPCLADCGLSSEDTSQITRKGTPVYLAPSWYVESSGNPDMWGCACLLYVLLTGNSPDKMGKASFIWPPSGEASLSGEEKSEWWRLHQLVHRATADNHEERFLGFDRFQAAVANDKPLDGSSNSGAKYSSAWRTAATACISFLLIAAIAGYFLNNRNAKQPTQAPPTSQAEIVTKENQPAANENSGRTFSENAAQADLLITALEKETKPLSAISESEDHPAKLSEFLAANRYTPVKEFQKIAPTLEKIRAGIVQFDPYREKPKKLIPPAPYQEVGTKLEELQKTEMTLVEKTVLDGLNRRFDTVLNQWASNVSAMDFAWNMFWQSIDTRYWALVQNLHQEAEDNLAKLVSEGAPKDLVALKQTELKAIESLKPFPNRVFERRPDKLPDRGYDRGRWEDRF